MRCEYCQVAGSGSLCVAPATADPGIAFCDNCQGAYLADPRCTDESATWRSEQCNRCLAYAGDYRLNEGSLCKDCSCDKCETNPAKKGSFLCEPCESKPTIRFTCDLNQVGTVALRLSYYGLCYSSDVQYDKGGEITDTVVFLVRDTDLGNLRNALVRQCVSRGVKLPIPVTSMKEVV